MRNPAALAPLPTKRFGRFELRPEERVLLADGAPVTLGARAFDVLAALADRPGQLVTKKDLLATVWAGLVVEENNLQVQVSTLRKILGPNALATIPGRGYRFDLAIESGCAAPAPVAANDASTSVPSRAPRLFGRDDDVSAVCALVRKQAMVTITGAGGIGKTSVAQAVVRRLVDEHPDGVWWVELASLGDGALVAATVAQAVGLRAGGVDALRAALTHKHALLVLDNCEHLADDVAALVDALGVDAPHFRILVTSQETLKVTDEHLYRLGALAIPDDEEAAARSGAVELFVARASALDPHFALTASNRRAVIEICRRLDGIPLAIELAAARVPLLGVEGLCARLDERFNVLTGGARVVLRRHQTLRATLEWSHGLLTPEEQTVFRRLGVFAGGFTLEAAQQVASDESIDTWTALDHLGALVDKSLVLAEGDPVPRYRMLETTRAYSMERLAESGETQAILRRHAEAVVEVLAPFERADWVWAARDAQMAAPRVELDNVRVALDWADGADARLAVRLVAVSYSVWWSSQQLAEGLSRCLALRPHIAQAESPQDVAGFWLTVGKLGLYSTRRESYEAAVLAAQLYRELDDDRRRFDALIFATVEATRLAPIADIEAHLLEAAALERPEWPARQRAKLQFARCWGLARQERYEEALAAAQRQVAICREGGIEVSALYGMSNVTALEIYVDRPEAALAHARESIARLHALGADDGAGHLYWNMTVALLLLDRVAEARAAAGASYERLIAEGDEHRVVLPLALLHAREGRLDAAARISAFADAYWARQGERMRTFEPMLRARLDPLLAQLSAQEREALARQGAALSEQEAFRLALA